MTTHIATIEQAQPTENLQPGPRLNVARWNSLRLAVEKDGMAGWYAWAGSYGSPLPFWEVSALELVSRGKAADSASMLRRQAGEVLDPASKRIWRMTPDEARAALALLDAGVEGRVSKEAAHDRWTLNMNCLLEAGRLHVPGKVFKTADFKGGATSPLTWVYVLRAHCRKVPRLHLRRTLDEQGAMLEAALREAPTLFAGLFEPSPDASAPAAGDLSG